MSEENIKKFVSIYDSLESDRSSVEQLWDQIERYVLPFSGDMYDDSEFENSKDWRNRSLYDSTAVVSAQTLAAAVHGALTSPASKWFSLEFVNQIVKDDQEAMEWLDEAEKICYASILASNFSLEASDLYLFLVSFGTAAMTQENKGDMEKEWGGFQFTNIPIKEFVFQSSPDGEVIHFFRKVRWTADQIKAKFPSGPLPQRITDILETDQSASQKITLLFCIYKRDKYDIDMVLAPERRKYGFKYILYETGEDVGEEGGYYECPVYIPRWRRAQGSSWGYGPATISLSDILTLNKLTELVLKAADKAIDPPVVSPERNVMTDLSMKSGGFTIVRDPSKLVIFESKARFDVSQLQRDNLIKAIRAAFHVDQLEMKESPAMTATEVTVRYELMQRLLGPTVGQLQNDLLTKMVERTFYALFRANQFPPIPQILLNNDPEITIKYSGPLARSQKQDDVNATRQWIASVVELAEFSPTVLDLVDFDDAIRSMAEGMSVPASSVKGKAEVAQTRNARQEQEQQQQQMNMAQQGSEIAKNMGGAGGVPQ